MSSQEPQNAATRDGDSSPASPESPTPSARVRLEVEILGSDLSAQRDTARPVAATSHAHERGTVLIVVGDAALRHYVRECLRDVARFRVRDVASARELLELAPHAAPRVAITDRSAEHLVIRLADVRVIIIDDEAPAHSAPHDARRVLLAMPFSGDVLIAEIDRLLT